MVVAAAQLPPQCFHPIVQPVCSIMELPHPLTDVFTNGVFFDSTCPVDTNFFGYITGNIADGLQPGFRGTSPSHHFPTFDGNALLEFFPSPSKGISVLTLLRLFIDNPKKYAPKFGDLVFTTDPKQFRAVMIGTQRSLAAECELSVARPVPPNRIVSVRSANCAEGRVKMGRDKEINGGFNLQKTQIFPTNLDECIALAEKLRIF